MQRNSPVGKYKRYLLLEKGLSSNTIDAYMADLQKLLDFAESRNLSLSEISFQHLEEFLAGLYDTGIKARSVARILSGVKSFFQFLMLDGYIEEDPSQLLESSQGGDLKLPVVLSLKRSTHPLPDRSLYCRRYPQLCHYRDTLQLWPACVGADKPEVFRPLLR